MKKLQLKKEVVGTLSADNAGQILGGESLQTKQDCPYTQHIECPLPITEGVQSCLCRSYTCDNCKI